MRLFAAVDLDPAARAAIAEEQRRLRSLAEGASPMRWVRPEQLHMTLVFLGEVDDERGRSVVGEFSRPFALAPFALSFRGLGVFPDHGAPRALWIGVADGADALHALRRELAARALRQEIALEPRPFSPHLTLARWKQSRPSDRGRLLTHASEATLGRTAIDCATLYRSQLSSQGPTYTALARVTLTAPR